MQIVGRSREIQELAGFLQDEIESLATTEHPMVHLFLVQGLATGIVRRSLAVSQEATMVLCEAEQGCEYVWEGETA